MAENRHISLLELQQQIKAHLDLGFALPLWVSAEISDLKVNYSGHCYMELVEKGGDNAVPRAKANAVIWRSSYTSISSHFTQATGIELGAGIKVLVKISVNFHELYGMSFQITDIDPMYTLGDIEQMRRQTIERLQAEGVFDMNRELEVPVPAQRIAVVSSANAAGWQDFYNELMASGYLFDVTLFDSFMQGAGAEDSLVNALERIGERYDDFDVVVIIRGGGSQSDLSCFNSYRLCSHVAQFPLPVVTGIGHDKDQSVADLVASVSLKTPTAVARFLVDGMAQTQEHLDVLYDALVQSAVTILDGERRRVERCSLALSGVASGFGKQLALRLQRLETELVYRAETAISRERTKVALAEAMVENRRPEKILSLGFSIVRRDGVAVRNGADLRPGDNVEIVLNNGGAQAEIKKII